MRLEPISTFRVKAILDRYYRRRDVKTFCWWPRTLLTLERAWLRTVYGRQRREDGVWEYYSRPYRF